MGKINFIFVIVEDYLEGKRLIETAALLLHWVLIVADVKTISHPSRVFIISSMLRRIYQRFHSFIVWRFWLDQINDIEFISYVLSCVAHFKEIPLSVIACRIIVLKDEVIFIRTYLHRTSQITWLESWLKDKCRVTIILFYIIRLKFSVISIYFDSFPINIVIVIVILQRWSVRILSSICKGLFLR